MDDRTPPNDFHAEQAVIGSIITDRGAWEKASEIITDPADFYRPIHEFIWNAVVWLDHHSQPIDPVSVLGRLSDEGKASNVGGAPYLLTCIQSVPATANVDFWAGKVADKATVRRTIDALNKGLQAAWSGISGDEALEQAEAELLGVQTRESGDYDTLMNLAEFNDRDLGPQDWVIPGLLERQERLILTGAEGLGKSTLVRQIGLCVAAGMNPFSGQTFAPRKVLVVDAENPDRLMQTRFRHLAAQVTKHVGSIDPTQLWIDRRPQGINLRDPRGRRWLNKRLSLVQPDLLVMGPLYKMFIGDPNDEQIISEVANQLDQYRVEYGCALGLEHHMKKGDGANRSVEPIGSSVWLRWPEFGFGLRPLPDPDQSAADNKARRLCEFVPWRGGRDDTRDWPFHLESGRSDRDVPWVMAHPSTIPGP